MKFFLLLTVLLLASTSLTVQKTSNADYCWRNYNGEVPDDAIVAGVDKLGNPIYIGQGFFLTIGLLPGTLHPGSTQLKITASKKVHSTDKYVKILCSGHPNNFRWISVKSYSDIAQITNVHLVEGGIETDSIVNIGRVQHEGSTEIGKVYNISPYQGLALPNREETETSYQSFDILIYDFGVVDVRYDI